MIFFLLFLYSLVFIHFKKKFISISVPLSRYIARCFAFLLAYFGTMRSPNKNKATNQALPNDTRGEKQEKKKTHWQRITMTTDD